MNYPSSAIGDVATIVTGKTPSTNDESNFGGSIPFVTPAELDLDEQILETPRTVSERGASKLKLVPENSILVCCIGSLGKVGIAGKELATNQQINAVVFDESKVHPRFGYYALKLLKPKMEAVAPATTVKIISKSKFSELEIPLPPLDEQKRIANILDQADALRRLRKRAFDRLNTLGLAIFHEMFSGANVNGESFRRVELSEVIQKGDKINYGVVQPGDAVEDGVPLVRVGDLLKPLVNQYELKRISKSVEEKYSRSRLNGDEILVACVGSIGAIALADSSMSGFNIARAVARLPVDESQANRLFLAEQLKTQKVQRYFKSETRAVAQPTLNIKQLKETEIFLPSMKQQLKFAERLEGLRDHISLHARGMEKVEIFFASLTNRAFRGEL